MKSDVGEERERERDFFFWTSCFSSAHSLRSVAAADLNRRHLEREREGKRRTLFVLLVVMNFLIFETSGFFYLFHHSIEETLFFSFTLFLSLNKKQ